MPFNLNIIRIALFLAAVSNCFYFTQAQSVKVDSVNVYFFPGQGSDQRIFNNYELPDYCIKHFFKLPMPYEGEMLDDYAERFISEIDTSRPFVLVGTSLGGMICSELTDRLDPIATIVIASAKNKYELPGQYRLQRTIPLNKLPPPMFFKVGSFIAQPIVEPDRNQEKQLFLSMLRANDPVYLKRTVNMIINWPRTETVAGVYHIHGNLDRTLPIKNISYDTLIDFGSHMMTYLRSEEISTIVYQRIELAVQEL